MSFTRTHVHISFANPHLVCTGCHRFITGFHDSAACGCDDPMWNVPCGCEHFGIISTCPSWSPVDGCTCTPACPAALR